MKTNIDWNEVFINACLNAFNALIETNKHAIIEEPIVDKAYAKTAVKYASSLVKEMREHFDKIITIE